jgi:cyclophilin family peptidyl-prolyl cis-trans isomerase
MTSKGKNINRKRSRPVEPKKFFTNIKITGILLIIIVIIIFSAVILFIGSDSNNDNNVVNDEKTIAIIETSMGTIEVELFKDMAPITCENFIKYVNDGFYNGLVFHRVIDNFVIQGGGFYPNGSKKETYDPIDLEINEELSHVDGAIAMARTSDPNSATSQFFINDGPQPNLEPGGVDPHGYAVFGKVIKGMEIVRSIAMVETTTKYSMSDWPINDIILENITINVII